MSIQLSEFLRTLTDDQLAERMAGFKAHTKEYILGQQEFARRQREGTVSQPKERTMSKLKVFISHSSKDKLLAGALADLLRAAIGISPEAIRCTSVDGYRLPAGAKTDPVLQRETQEAETLIGVITMASIESAYVLFELGARWGSDKHLIPVLGGGADGSYLRGPLSGYNALQCDDRGQLLQLIGDIADVLQMPPYRPDTYQAQIETVISASAQSARAKSTQPAELILPPLTQEQHTIMQIFASWDYGGLDPEALAKHANLTIFQCKYHLQVLVDRRYVVQASTDPVTYTLTHAGRKFAMDNNLRLK